jgi:hypothetical protein
MNGGSTPSCHFGRGASATWGSAPSWGTIFETCEFGESEAGACASALPAQESTLAPTKPPRMFLRFMDAAPWSMMVGASRTARPEW